LLALTSSPPARASAAGVISREKLAVSLDTLPAANCFCAATASPSGGGCAYRQHHQGPGIRCLLEGGIRIDTAGRSTSYGPAAPGTRRARARVRAGGRSAEPLHPRDDPAARVFGQKIAAIRRPADAAKPRAQRYQIFADIPIAAPRGSGRSVAVVLHSSCPGLTRHPSKKALHRSGWIAGQAGNNGRIMKRELTRRAAAVR